MNHRSHDDLSKQVNRLQKGIVFAIGVSIVSLVIALFFAFYPPIIENRIARALSQSNGFHDLSTKDKISEASVILRTENNIREGIIQAVIVEIWKLEDQTEFYYDVGDEYPTRRRQQRDSVDYGDGNIVFLQGSPASLVYGVSYRGDRIRQLGGMTLETLRERIAEQAERGNSE